MKYRIVTVEDVEFDTEKELEAYVERKEQGLYWVISEWSRVHPIYMERFLSSMVMFANRMQTNAEPMGRRFGRKDLQRDESNFRLGLHGARFKAAELLYAIGDEIRQATDEDERTLLEHYLRSTMADMIQRNMYLPTRMEFIRLNYKPEEIGLLAVRAEKSYELYRQMPLPTLPDWQQNVLHQNHWYERTGRALTAPHPGEHYTPQQFLWKLLVDLEFRNYFYNE